jgi:hypothetical protein
MRITPYKNTPGPAITIFDKNGVKVSNKKFLAAQKENLFDGNIVLLSKLLRGNTLINKKDVDTLVADGLIVIKKYKGKKYLSQDEWSYAMKVLERRRVINNNTTNQKGGIISLL